MQSFFPTRPTKYFTHDLKPLELAFPPDPVARFAWDPAKTFKIDLLGANDDKRNSLLRDAFAKGRIFLVALNLLHGLSFSEFYGSYPIILMKGDGASFEVS